MNGNNDKMSVDDNKMIRHNDDDDEIKVKVDDVDDDEMNGDVKILEGATINTISIQKKRSGDSEIWRLAIVMESGGEWWRRDVSNREDLVAICCA